MPNPQEIVAVAKAAESVVARMAPNLAEKLVADLPAIFGGRGMRVAEQLAHTPKDAIPVTQVAEAYQANLAKYGLAKDASISELYTAARQAGREPLAPTHHNGFRNSSSSSEIVLDDGSVLKSRANSSRHGAYRSTDFLSPGNETQLSYSTSNTRNHGRNASWSIRTPNFEHTTDKRLF